MNNSTHEQLVKNFLKSKGLPETYMHYDNVLIYTKAKQILNLSIVSVRDRKIFNKFIKNWVIHKGDVNKIWLTRINNMLKYYTIKKQSQLHNENQKHLRLAKKQNNARALPNSV